jgi:hypothetical protein
VANLTPLPSAPSILGTIQLKRKKTSVHAIACRQRKFIGKKRKNKEKKRLLINSNY